MSKNLEVNARWTFASLGISVITTIGLTAVEDYSLAAFSFATSIFTGGYMLEMYNKLQQRNEENTRGSEGHESTSSSEDTIR
jgi:hypothetical protein